MGAQAHSNPPYDVIAALWKRINAGVYEPCQSAYRSNWFCVVKKNGKLCIVHDLQELNGVFIRDAGTLPIIDEFVERFGGSVCYTVLDPFSRFDAQTLHAKSYRDAPRSITANGPGRGNLHDCQIKKQEADVAKAAKSLANH